MLTLLQPPPLAATGFVGGASSYSAAGLTSYVQPFPAGIRDGDLMILTVAQDSSTPIGVTVPGGWTLRMDQAAGNSWWQVWTKVYASDGASVTVTPAVLTPLSVSVAAWRGYDTVQWGSVTTRPGIQFTNTAPALANTTGTVAYLFGDRSINSNATQRDAVREVTSGRVRYVAESAGGGASTGICSAFYVDGLYPAGAAPSSTVTLQDDSANGFGVAVGLVGSSATLAATAGLSASADVVPPPFSYEFSDEFAVDPRSTGAALPVTAGMAVTASTSGGGTTHTASAALAATAALTASASVSRETTAALTATAAATVVGSRSYVSSLSSSATAALSATGAVVRPSTASLSAVAGLTAAASVTRAGAAALTATAALTASAGGTQSATSSLSATASVVSAGSVTKVGSGSLAGVAGLTASASVVRAGSSTITAAGSLTASGLVARFGGSPTSVTASITASASVTRAGSATLSATATLVAQGLVPLMGQATTTVSAAVVATASVTTAASASLSGTAGLVVDGSVVVSRIYVWAGTQYKTSAGMYYKTATGWQPIPASSAYYKTAAGWQSLG